MEKCWNGSRCYPMVPADDVGTWDARYPIVPVVATDIRDAMAAAASKCAKICPCAATAGEALKTQRGPHWKVTVLVPFGWVTMLDVIGCEPYFWQ